ncbi:hypothetical protein DV736_g6708, partial [Chaetothyriales sp. CBS 134916]
MASSTSTAAESATVYLKSPSDWTRWLALIKTRAANNHLWRYIDPQVKEPPQFSEPIKPTPSSYTTANTTSTTTASLTPEQFQRYSVDIQAWQEETRIYWKKQKVMTEIEDHIIRTAGAYWSTIEDATGVHARLIKLQERVAPTN